MLVIFHARTTTTHDGAHVVYSIPRLGLEHERCRLPRMSRADAVATAARLSDKYAKPLTMAATVAMLAGDVRLDVHHNVLADDALKLVRHFWPNLRPVVRDPDGRLLIYRLPDGSRLQIYPTLNAHA